MFAHWIDLPTSGASDVAQYPLRLTWCDRRLRSELVLVRIRADAKDSLHVEGFL